MDSAMEVISHPVMDPVMKVIRRLWLQTMINGGLNYLFRTGLSLPDTLGSVIFGEVLRLKGTIAEIQESFSHTSRGFGETTQYLKKNNDTVVVIQSLDAPPFGFKLLVGKLREEHAVLWEKADRIEDIAASISKASELDLPIQGLFLSAHGNRDLISLGSLKDISFDNVKYLKPSLAQLDPSARITLASCSVAEGKDNIARRMAAVAGGREVCGPTSSTSFLSKRITDSRDLKIRFSHWLPSMLLPFDQWIYPTDVTRCYKLIDGDVTQTE